MAEKINIAEFDIDVDALIKNAQDVKQRLDEIKTEMREMTKAGKTSSEAFINNAVSAKSLTSEYNAQLKVLQQVNSTTGKAIPIQQRIDAVLSRQETTIEGLRKQNADLIKVRNQVNLTTEEGEQQLIELNKQLDINNGLIVNNVSQLEQQKIGIGGYADALRDVIGQTGLFNNELGNVTAVMNSFKPIVDGIKTELNEVGTAFKTAAAGTEGMTAAQKASTVATNLSIASLKLLKVALIGTGIGAIVVLLGSMVAYLNSSEQASNKLGKVLGVLGGIVQRLFDYLEPLGELLVDGLVAGFELLGKVATATINQISNGLRALGFTDAADGLKEFNNEMDRAADRGAKLAEAEQKLAESQRYASLVQLQYQTAAEKLRQVRDDETRTIEERMQANADLGDLLEEQLKKEQAIALQAVNAARLRAEAYGATKANMDALAEAQTNLIDIGERLAGQESEQQANLNSLRRESAQLAKDAEAQAKEAAQKRIEQLNAELALYKEQNSGRAMTIEQTLALEQDLANRQQEILQQSLKNRLISQTEYDTQVLALQNSLNQRKIELAQENLDYELSLVQDQADVQLAQSKAVGMARLEEELRISKEIADAKAEYESQRFKQGITDANEYRDAVLAIQQEQNLQEIELKNQKDELIKEQDAQRLALMNEAEMLGLEARFANQFEMRSAMIEQEKEQQLIAAREMYTDKALLDQAVLNINQAAANAELQIEKEKNNAKLQSSADLAGALSELLGKETAAGKAAAIAQATINTYLGVSQALATLPPPASYIAAAATAATGIANVAKIVGTKAGNTKVDTSAASSGKTETPVLTPITLDTVAPFATGGLVTGGIPVKRSNGDNVLATLRTGEVVLNKDQQRRLGGADTFASIGVPGFANGGVVSSTIPGVQSSISRRANLDLGETISKAVKEGARQGTEEGAQAGIIDASTETYLRNLSSF